MLKSIGKILASLVAVVALGWAVTWVYDICNRPNMVTSILNLSSVPSTLRVLGCESPVTTDVLTVCSVSVDPKEFPRLLAGYRFEQSEVDGTSYSLVPEYGRIGAEFSVTARYAAENFETEHGGHLFVLANQDRSRAIVDLYIE